MKRVKKTAIRIWYIFLAAFQGWSLYYAFAWFCKRLWTRTHDYGRPEHWDTAFSRLCAYLEWTADEWISIANPFWWLVCAAVTMLLFLIIWTHMRPKRSLLAPRFMDLMLIVSIMNLGGWEWMFRVLYLHG